MDMNESELRNYVRFLYGQVNAKDKSIQELLEELRGMRKDYQKLLSCIDSLTLQLEKRNLENRDLKEQNGILKSELYNSSKSRKGIKKNQRIKGKNHDHDDNPDDDSPSPESSSTNSVGSVEQEKNESDTVYHGPSRKGATYNKCVVGEPIVHKCALDKLPAGTVVLKVVKPKVVRTVVNYIEEHHFERVKVKYPDGRIRTVYLLEDDDMRAHLYNEVVPGTHITASLLAFLLFNRYQMASPDYRKSKNRLTEMDWNTCRQNLADKFKDAYNQGCEQARFFLEKIAALYRCEYQYRDNNRTSDNMAAKRAIRPMTVQRKNSLFFGSTKGAIRSAIYNTFIETCKQAKISFQQFFCRFLEELNKGRTDYENLLPMTICLKS